MAKLQTDTLQGGRLVDRDGRRQVVLVDVNAAKLVTDQIEGGLLTDQDGREYVAVQSSLATKIASLSGNPADDVKAVGAGTGAQISVVVLSAPNVFTTTQTFKAPGAGGRGFGPVSATHTDSSGNPLFEISQLDGGGAGRYACQATMFGKNGLGPGGAAWYIAIDIAAAIPDRDFALGKFTGGTAESDPDGIYISNGGVNPATLGFGISQPGDAAGFAVFKSNRVKVMGGATTQGGVEIVQFGGQTAPLLTITDSGGADQFTIAPSAIFDTWVTTWRADPGSLSTVLNVVNALNAAQKIFELKSDASLTLQNFNTSTSVVTIKNANQTFTVSQDSTGDVTIGNTGGGTLIGIGNHAVGWPALGFYGATPVLRAARAGQLTDSTGGAVSSTLAAGITDTVAKNAIASLAAKVNALETIIHNLGLSA